MAITFENRPKRLISLKENRSMPLDQKLKRKPVWIFVLFLSMKINQWKAIRLKLRILIRQQNNSATNYSLLTLGTELLACKLITFLHVIQRSWFDSNQRISLSYKVISHNSIKTCLFSERRLLERRELYIHFICRAFFKMLYKWNADHFLADMFVMFQATMTCTS